MFLVAGVASILFLLKMSKYGEPGKTGTLARIVAKLPDAQTLDRIAYRTTIFGFPVFGFGVIFGAIWAEEAWVATGAGTLKETVSFIAWVVYAAYLHARSTAGWRDKKAAWINVVGFVAMVFNLFFINLVTVGLHSMQESTETSRNQRGLLSPWSRRRRNSGSSSGRSREWPTVGSGRASPAARRRRSWRQPG